MERKNRKRKKNRNKLLKVCIVLLIVVLGLEIAIIVKDVKSDKLVSDNEILIGSVQTPITDIVYGFESVDRLVVKVNEKPSYDVTFLADVGEAKSVEILKFYFDDDSNGTPVGTINDKNGKKTKVSVQEFDFSDLSNIDDEDKIILSHVQEEMLDSIMSNLEIVENPSEEEIIKSKNILIETPYLNIPFSKEWEEYLDVEQIEGEPYKVVFNCKFDEGNSVELFTYAFGEGATGVIGELGGVPVGIIESESKVDSNWSQEQVDIFYTMKEEMNCIIDYLASTGEFSFK